MVGVRIRAVLANRNPAREPQGTGAPMRSVASIAGALVLLAPHAAAQKPQFRTGVDLVVVDALVTDHGKPVEGLTAVDFDLRDEGVPQQVNLATTAGNVNVVLALDTSESLAGENL